MLVLMVMVVFVVVLVVWVVADFLSIFAIPWILNGKEWSLLV